MADDLESLRGVLTGLGLTQLPKLLHAIHKARNAGRNVDAGRAPHDDGTPAAPPGGVGPAGDGEYRNFKRYSPVGHAPSGL